MAKPGGGKPGGNKPGRRLQTQARRDVRVSHMPQQNAIDRLIAQQNADFQNKWQGYGSIYAGEQKALEPLYGQYQKATANILPDLQNQYQQFAGTLNQAGLPTNELSANTALAGQYGNNAANTLASNQQRALGSDQSAMRESGLSERYGKQNLMQGLSDQLQQLYNQKSTIADQSSSEVLSRLDYLRQQQKQNQQDKAYADLIASLTGNALNSSDTKNNNHNNSNNPTVTPGAGQPGAGIASSNVWNGQNGRGPGVAGILPNGVQQWRNREVGWGDLSKPQRRRIRRKDIQRNAPSVGTVNSTLGGAETPGYTPDPNANTLSNFFGNVGDFIDQWGWIK